jgi:hypothetical protein
MTLLLAIVDQPSFNFCTQKSAILVFSLKFASGAYNYLGWKKFLNQASIASLKDRHPEEDMDTLLVISSSLTLFQTLARVGICLLVCKQCVIERQWRLEAGAMSASGHTA